MMMNGQPHYLIFKNIFMTNEKQNGVTEEKSVAFKKGYDTVPETLLLTDQKEKATIVDEDEKKKADKEKKDSSSETDSETLKTTDPQEKMEGPISSIMQNIKEQGEANDVVSKKEADKKKDENT
jgi:hypothetical protein